MDCTSDIILPGCASASPSSDPERSNGAAESTFSLALSSLSKSPICVGCSGRVLGSSLTVLKLVIAEDDGIVTVAGARLDVEEFPFESPPELALPLLSFLPLLKNASKSLPIELSESSSAVFCFNDEGWVS